MKKIKFIALGISVILMVTGCTNTQKGAAIGTAGGAALGAVVGKLAGNTLAGTVVGTAVGATAGTLIGNHMDKVKQQAEAIEDAQVETVTDTNGLEAVKVTFNSGILFDSSSYELQSTAQITLAQFSTVLIQNADADVSIYGFTDNQGWKNSTATESVQKNLTLSRQRAQAVSTYLIGLGVSTSQIKVVEGYGESNPVADNSTSEGQAQNRRVEIYLYASESMIEAANNGTL